MKDYEKNHICPDGKMPPSEIIGVLVRVDKIWYQIKGNHSQNIRNCPFCGEKLQ
jgi:hypothetical protein